MNAFLDLSVVIITFNEADRIARCLESLPAGAEIILLDSGSNDATVEIARSFGALVMQRAFDNFANQKNAALALATRKWVLSIDADEFLDADLCRFVSTKSKSEEKSIFKLKRRLVFMGRTMRFGKTQDSPLRFFPRGMASFENAVHERLVTELPIAFAQGFIFHVSYRNVSDYFQRFNRYTTLVAQGHFARQERSNLALLVLRPFSEFFTRYLLRLGFLDGYAGYCYALFSSLYAFTKYVKLRELEEEQS